jgi:hypothetical protein
VFVCMNQGIVFHFDKNPFACVSFCFINNFSRQQDNRKAKLIKINKKNRNKTADKSNETLKRLTFESNKLINTVK